MALRIQVAAPMAAYRHFKLGDSMVATSRDLRHRSAGWWIEAFAATTVSWISRYLVVNALFLGFVPSADQLV